MKTKSVMRSSDELLCTSNSQERWGAETWSCERYSARTPSAQQTTVIMDNCTHDPCD